ncbi:hypothetical protein [Bradyrhizobium liaoningense]|uniref:hypothetical protein n=1 Tax=Bradyrhizobium liaoningense TaxID=43992 RepID=UPI001BA998A9|nr:hypothetical protein [Bradyrhizobium liaoningense]MBR0819802.1 hypothetical protein [Bradyrhizobium liaoningense]
MARSEVILSISTQDGDETIFVDACSKESTAAASPASFLLIFALARHAFSKDASR